MVDQEDCHIVALLLLLLLHRLAHMDIPLNQDPVSMHLTTMRYFLTMSTTERKMVMRATMTTIAGKGLLALALRVRKVVVAGKGAMATAVADVGAPDLVDEAAAALIMVEPAIAAHLGTPAVGPTVTVTVTVMAMAMAMVPVATMADIQPGAA